MNRRFVHHLLLASVALLAVAVPLFLAAASEERAELAWAKSLLLTGDLPSAEGIFRRQHGSLWTAAEAQAGLAIVAALTGQGEPQRAPAEVIARFPLAQLLRRALSEGQFEACLRLIELGGREAFRVYAAAALLELAKEEEAAEVWSGATGRAPTSFEGRVARALELRQRGASSLIHDRRGRLLGIRNGEGGFRPLDGVAPETIPRAILDRIEPYAGVPGLRLSLDRAMSEMALASLGQARGSIVVVHSESGEVMVAVSDGRTWAGGGSPAFEQRREPASIAKLITTTAALRAGIDADGEISRMVCRGAVRLNGNPLYCTAISGRLSGLAEALAVSCNVAFAELGLRVGRERLLKEHRLYGFERADGDFDIFGRILQEGGDERQLGDLAIGLDGANITPLHAALLAAVLANQGVMPSPKLFNATDGLLGLSPKELPGAAGRSVLDPRWLPTLHAAMEAVVGAAGTAAGVAPPGFPVAMKTGTGRDPGWNFHANYIGIAPMPDPQLAFCVRITHQPTSKRVRRAAQRVTKRFLSGLVELAQQRPLGRDGTDPGGQPAL